MSSNKGNKGGSSSGSSIGGGSSNKGTTKGNNTTKEASLLSEDPVLSDQQWVVLSFLSPERVQGSQPGVRGVKVRGSYATYEEAVNRAKYIRDSIDDKFDVFVGQVGRWLPWDSRDHVEDEVYADEALNNLMKAYTKQQELSKQELDKRRLAETAKKHS